jgi:TldD protein
MNRRKFLISSILSIPGYYLLKPNRSELMSSIVSKQEPRIIGDDVIKKAADSALTIAKKRGSSYADFRLSNFRSQNLSAHEDTVQRISDNEDFGFSVRVLLDGVWGFAAGSTFNESEVKRLTEFACNIAKANKKIQKRRIELAPVPAYNDTWKTPITKDPFDVPIDEKINLLLSINEKAKSLGANYCDSFVWSVIETKHFVSTSGSYIKQEMYRIWPEFNFTIIGKSSGKFESRKSLTAPIGMGYEYVEGYNFFGDLEKAVEETKQKMHAKSVEPGKKDIILDPTNLWLTIHESCGHAAELDRALGFEANYAGTSFLTPDKYGKLKYGSDKVTLVADRTQKDGLATRGYDDDGVKTTQWDIIRNGVFSGYETTREMAEFIQAKESNACAFADSWAHFPIQRMPNVSLKPGTSKLTLNDMISDTEDGIYIVGDGSWSIDMQRYNFQFGGQVFYEIKNGKIAGLLRDVAYQGNTVNFWNSCDAVCDATEYKLGGSFFCGKGEPSQSAPVSHGSSPARFRKVNILNTAKEALR